MNFQSLTSQFAIAAQLRAADMAAAAAAGFRSVVNNRPDGEAPGQPSSAEIEAAAHAAGLAYAHIPISPNSQTDADVAAMREALADLPAPMLAFCRSGNRSGRLYSLAQSPG